MINEYSLETIYGNYTALGKFPLDCETLAAMQSNIMNYAVIAMIAGKDQLILSGCKVSGSRRTEGYVYIKSEETPLVGEILYHPESVNSSTCYIAEQPEDVTANGEQFTAAYTKRWLADGIGTTSYAWNNFVDISTITNAALNESLNTFKNSVNAALTDIQQGSNFKFIRGMIMMWSGTIAEIPAGWALCDGQNGTPNLRNRFIVGAGGSYNVGNTGGSNSVTLTVNQIPSHNHSGTTNTNSVISATSTTIKQPYNRTGYPNDSAATSDREGSNLDHGRYAYWRGGSGCDKTVITYSGLPSHTHSFTTGYTGSGSSHENRPPYYALAFIMKL